MINLFLTKLANFAAFNPVFNTGKPCKPHIDNPQHQFFGFPYWWKYIKDGEWDGVGNCVPKVSLKDGFEGILPIAFAIVDMLLYAAGIAAVVFIIIAGIAYMTADGNQEKAAAARKRILNALIGLAIVILAVPVVTFIGQRLVT